MKNGYENFKKSNGWILTLFLALFAFLSLFFISSLFGQTASEKPKVDKGAIDTIFKEEDFVPLNIKELKKNRIYDEIPLEDFEVNNYTMKNAKFMYEKGKQAGVSIRTEYPAPIPGSKRYLGIKIFGKKEDAISIYPMKPIIIDYYCKNLSIWTYGKGLTGLLSVLIKDSTGNTHMLPFGQLNHQGWRKMFVNISNKIIQKKQFINQANHITIISLVYNPGNEKWGNKWNYVYLDELTATIRGKYTDRQSDDW